MSYDSFLKANPGVSDILAKRFSVNRCGLVVEYTDYRELPKAKTPSSKWLSPNLSSRINRQKRIIENAVYALSEDSLSKVPVLVATCPVQSSHTTSNKNFSQFLNFFSHQKGGTRIKNYVWVREYQKNSRPHWHFCAEFEYISYKEMTDYWSGLWGSQSRNSIRKPKNLDNHFLRSKDLSNYLTKYFSKELLSRGIERSFQTDWGCKNNSKTKFWGMNAELRKKAEPKILRAGFDNALIDNALVGKQVVFSKNDVRYWR